MLLAQTMFCGMWEMAGLSQFESPEEAMKAAKCHLLDLGAKRRRIPYILFTGTCAPPTNLGHCNGRPDDYVEAFAAYIEENGLGTVLRTQELYNWTGNKVKVAIWQIEDHNNLWKFLEKLK